jgi:peptidoglycan/LPS O-acetylase OafA/YrhL
MPIVDVWTGLLAASCLVGLAATPRSMPARLFASRPLAGLGRFSYSVYLVHLPLLLIFDAVVGYLIPQVHTPMARTVLLLFIGVPIALSLSYAFFWCFERPFLTRKRDQAHNRFTPVEP